MPDIFNERIARRFAAAKTDRLRYEPMLDDAMRLTMPGRQRFSGRVEADDDDILDETGANATAEFASRMQAGLMPSFTPFVKLVAGPDVDDRDRRAVNRDLEEIEAFMFAEIWASNFQQETSEVLYDVALSAGTVLIEEGDNDIAFNHRAIPIHEMFLERGSDDQVGGHYRNPKRKAREVVEIYARDELPAQLLRDAATKPETEVEIIEATWRVSRPGNRAPAYQHTIILPQYKATIRDKLLEGWGANPFVTARWQTTAGEAWGRGPLMNALGAIRTTNLMVQLVLENAAMSIVGIYQSDNDATVNADSIRLLPGTILAKEVGTAGLEPIRPAGGQFNMQDVVLADQRVNIKRALFNDMLSDPNKTPASATEVVERMADLANRTMSGAGRMHYEYVVPCTQRHLYLLEKRGDIKMPVKGGRQLDYKAVSPIALAQTSRDLQRLMQDFQIRASIYGPQAAMSSYKMENLLPWLEERSGLDKDLFADPKQVIESMKQQAMAMQQAQQQMAAAGQPPAPV